MRRRPILLIAALAGFSVPVVAGIAGAKTFTLELAKGAKVTDQSGTTKTEKIAVTPRGFAVYWLSGDSAAHPKCTSSNGCFSFWPPVKERSARGLSKAPGIAGKLGTWRHDGFTQLTLSGHPLYNFSGDKHRDAAVGEGIHGFGGVWHVVSEGPAHAGSGSTTSGTGTTTTTGTTTMPGGTTTTTCAYPPYCY
jgi:predicted lipoprotein with Yx(FWY)xxD motif